MARMFRALIATALDPAPPTLASSWIPSPLVSVMGMELPNLINAATLLGIVLSLPTIGPMFLNALKNQDIYLAGTFLLGAQSKFS